MTLVQWVSSKTYVRWLSATLPELLLALFLTAGSWKTAAWLSGVQSRVDITMLCGFLAGLTALPHILRAPWTRAGLARLALFVAPLTLLALVLGLRVSPALSPYGIEKAARFATLTCLAFAAATATARDAKALLRLAGWLAVVALVRVLCCIAYPPALSAGTAVAGYLGSSRLSGLGAMAAFGVLMPQAKNALRRAAILLTTWPLLWWLGLAGARGPLLATLGAAAAFMYRSLASWRPLRFVPRLSRHGVLVIGILSAAVTIAPAFNFKLPIPNPWSGGATLTTSDRMRVLFAEAEGGLSVSTRLGFYRSAAVAFAGAPLFGTGTGTFRQGDKPSGTRAYPHNLFLEVASEQGLLGLAPLCILLAGTALVLARRPVAYKPGTGALLVGLLGLFVYALANSMLSGDINDNRVLFAICGLACGIFWRREMWCAVDAREARGKAAPRRGESVTGDDT